MNPDFFFIECYRTKLSPLEGTYINKMENQQLFKGVSKCYFGILLSLLHLNVNAQLSIKFDSSTSELYIFETISGEPKCLDTLPFLNSNYYSFHLKDRQLFGCWYVDGSTDPFYVFDSWIVNDNGKTVPVSKYFMPLKQYRAFRERKVKMTLNETGIRLYFEKGSVREVVMSYSTLEKESKLKSTLKSVAKMLDDSH